MSQRRIITLWLLLVLGVTVGSLLPASTLHALHYPNLPDKAVHATAYAVLGFVPTALLEWTAFAIALASSTIPLGIAIEFLQRLVPGRSCELGDVVADVIGTATGVLLALWIRKSYRAKVPSA